MANSLIISLMYSNWLLRSSLFFFVIGLPPLEMDLTLVFNEKFKPFKIFPTVVLLTGIPIKANSSTIFAVVFLVHFKSHWITSYFIFH